MCELCVEFIITSTWGYLFQLNVTKCQNSLKYYSYLNNEENLNTLSLCICYAANPSFSEVRKEASREDHSSEEHL